ncbi:hypothetical protein ACW18T_04860, partial [Limosilactobacillus fermentum]
FTSLIILNQSLYLTCTLYSGPDTSDGKPNMIVVHETADDDIWEEINYEKNTYEDAFVHAFIDGNYCYFKH